MARTRKRVQVHSLALIPRDSGLVFAVILMASIVVTYLLLGSQYAELLCMDVRFFQGDTWRLLTYMWIHADANHLESNLLGLGICALFAAKMFKARWWFSAYMAAGVLPVLWYTAVWPGEYSFAGASAAIFGLHGLVLAGSLRYLVMHRRVICPVGARFSEPLYTFIRIVWVGKENVSYPVFPLWLMPALTFALLASLMVPALFGPSDPGAFVVHGAGALIGFAAGLVLPIKTGNLIWTTRREVAESMTLNPEGPRLELTLSQDFNQARDSLGVDQMQVDWRGRPHTGARNIVAGPLVGLNDAIDIIASARGAMSKEMVMTRWTW
jgi:membrane associated rhomboid family serine protease